jgi:hypothetical protein
MLLKIKGKNGMISNGNVLGFFTITPKTIILQDYVMEVFFIETLTFRNLKISSCPIKVEKIPSYVLKCSICRKCIAGIRKKYL